MGLASNRKAFAML